MSFEKCNEWVFVAVPKSVILKRGDTYLLLDVGRDIDTSAIVSTKFLRKKETEEHVFLSLPDNYVIKTRSSMYDEDKHKYIIIKEGEMTPAQLKAIYE